MSKSKKKVKTPKFKKVSTIRHRLHKIWSGIVRKRSNHKCELCGRKKGDMGPNEKPINKIDAHHFLSKEIKDCPLKFEILNGGAVCPFCHKFGVPSFHRDPIRTITWLQENHPDRYTYVLENSDVRVDLENRMVLAEIEKELKEEKSLDLNKLKQIEEKFPRKTKTKIEGSLFDPESESSESSESSD